MPEIEYEGLSEILSHQQSYVESELGESLAAILSGVGEDE